MKTDLKRVAGVIYFSLLLASVAQAQTAGRAIVTQPAEWIVLTSNLKFHKRLGFAFDSNFRFVEAFQSSQYLVRTGLEIYVSPKLSIVPIGYGFFWNFKYGKQPAQYTNNERRFWQQIAYKQNFARVEVSHRLRFEERSIQAHHTATDGSVIDDGFTNHQFRVRYRLMANIPINHAHLDPKTWYLSLWDEIFMSWGKKVTYHHPDQNRIFIGPGYKFSKMISVQGGFLYQLLVKANGAQQENNAGALIQLNYNFDFTKK